MTAAEEAAYFDSDDAQCYRVRFAISSTHELMGWEPFYGERRVLAYGVCEIDGPCLAIFTGDKGWSAAQAVFSALLLSGIDQ